MLKADLYLASFDSSCWTAQVSNAFNGLQGSAMFKQKMLRATQVPMQEFICDLRFRHLKVWREANFSCPRAVNKKAVTYHKWYGSSESGPRGSPFLIPSYLSCKWHGGSSIVMNVSVEKFKMRSMCFSFESVLKFASCA